MTDLEKRLHNRERYKGFTYLDTPKEFCKLMKDKDYDTVQVHATDPIGDDDIVGFCGVFSWKNNVLTPLDGDSYNQNVLVYGYSEFTANNEKCIDILVGENW